VTLYAGTRTATGCDGVPAAGFGSYSDEYGASWKRIDDTTGAGPAGDAEKVAYDDAVTRFEATDSELAGQRFDCVIATLTEPGNSANVYDTTGPIELVGQRRSAPGEGHDRVGHLQQHVDRRAGGSVAVPIGIGRGKRRRSSGEGEVVQRGDDHRGMPPARRSRLDGAQRLVGLAQGDRDALVQRRRLGGIDLGEAPVRLSQRAGLTRGCGASCGRRRHPEDSRLAIGTKPPTL
jgi:hypothetical protein